MLGHGLAAFPSLMSPISDTCCATLVLVSRQGTGVLLSGQHLI